MLEKQKKSVCRNRHSFLCKGNSFENPNYSWLIAPDGHAPAHVPQSIQESASISYLPSPALIAPTGHSPSQVPQLIHSSEITYAISISSFKFRLLQNSLVLYSLFYTRFPPISSRILRKILVKLYYFQTKNDIFRFVSLPV